MQSGRDGLVNESERVMVEFLGRALLIVVCVSVCALIVYRVQVEEDVEVPKRHHSQHPRGDCLQRAHHVQEHTSPRAL